MYQMNRKIFIIIIILLLINAIVILNASNTDLSASLRIQNNTSINKTIKINIIAPENADVNLSIITPSNKTESFYLKEIGSFVHLYTPRDEGQYRVNAIISKGGKITNLSKTFRIIGTFYMEKTELMNRFNISKVKVARVDGKYDLNLSVGESSLSIKISYLSNLRNIKLSKIRKALIKNKYFKLQTDVVAVDINEKTEIILSLRKYDNVNAILKCSGYNFNKDRCDRWVLTDIPFRDNGTHIYFSANSSSVYAGSYITIINAQSYPIVGGNWTVKFETIGKGNLTIKAINGTEFNRDLQFLEIRCGNKSIGYDG